AQGFEHGIAAAAEHKAHNHEPNCKCPFLVKPCYHVNGL
ncbi:MAG: hypothetical protein RJA97_588, partial [Bacteroidota bacterium]